MKIITKLKLAAWAPLLVALIIGTSLFLSHLALENAQEKNRTARRIMNGAQELNNFTRTYMLHHEDRPKKQFLMEYHALSRLIDNTSFKDKEQRGFLENIRQNLEAMRNAFIKLVSNYERSGLMENIPLRKEAEERLAGQILIRSRDSVANALRLKDLVDEEIIATQKRISALIFLLIACVTLSLALLLSRMTGNIAASFATLRKGTQYIASGDLKHRIGLSTHDEIGELARAFDLMAEQLGEITVSRNELIKEVEERTQAEEALRRISQFPKENPHPVMRVTLAGVILYANSSARHWLGTLGWQSGRPLPDVAQKTVADAYGRDHHIDTEITNPAGRVYHFSVIQPPGEDYVNFYGFDITDRKQAEEQINRKNRLVSGANRILELSLKSQTEKEMGMACLEVVEEVTESAIGFINEVADEENLRGIAVSNPGWDMCRMTDNQGHQLLGDFKKHGIYGAVVRDGKSFFTNDPASHPDRIGLPEGHPPLESFLGVPLLREGEVIGMVAVGNRPGGYGEEELETLEALAPIIVETFERRRAEDNLRRLKDELEMRVERRTAELTAANRELEAFSYSVSHDLRTPLRSIDGFSKILLDKYLDRLDERGQNYLSRISRAATKMGDLIDDLLKLSRIGRARLNWKRVDISELSQSVVNDLRLSEPERPVQVEIASGMTAHGDGSLLRIALENLIGNAWKFTGAAPDGRIEIGGTTINDRSVFYVRDNGAGFEMAYVDKLFEPFQRLHTMEEFPGSGIGLTIVKRIITRHGGDVWAEGAVGKGTTIYFTMGDDN